MVSCVSGALRSGGWACEGGGPRRVVFVDRDGADSRRSWFLKGGWFEENVSRNVGSGADTFFWTNRWIGEISLCERFRQLFDLTVDKWVPVVDMYALGWGGEA